MRASLRSHGRNLRCKLTIVALLFYFTTAAVVMALVAIVQYLSLSTAEQGITDHYVASLLVGHVSLVATWLSIFAGSLAAGLAGFAFSAIASALLFHWLAPIEAVPLLILCSITAQLIGISKLWRTMQWRRCFPYLMGGIAGIPLGAMLLKGFSPHTFAAGFGVLLILYSAYMLARPHVTYPGGGRLAEIAAGFAGGITGGATAFPGAFPTIWCNIRGMSKVDQRGIVQPFILLMQIATLIYFSKLGIFASATWSTFFWCIPAVVIGTWVGLQLFDRVDDARFRQIVLLFLLLSGAALII